MTFRTARLGDICDVNPKMPKSLDDSAGASFLPMAAVSEEGRIVFEEERTVAEVKKGYTYFERGDVLVAKITPCFENGKASRTDSLGKPFGFGSTEFHVLRPANDVDPNFLFYKIWNASFRELGAQNMTGSAGQKRVPADFLKRLEIFLPPLADQRRIAAILDKADALRRKRNDALKFVRKLTDALINELLDASRIINLGEIVTEGPTNGLYKPSKDYGKGVPILRINNFYDGRIVDLSSLRRLSVTDSSYPDFKLTNDDIVINRVNSLEYLGKSTIVRGLQEPTVYESNMMRLSLNKSIMLPDVCIALLQTPGIKRQILANAKNAVNQSSINQRDVCGLRLALPTMEIQQRFVARMSEIADFEVDAVASEVSLNSLFSSLQSRAFSDQL